MRGSPRGADVGFLDPVDVVAGSQPLVNFIVAKNRHSAEAQTSQRWFPETTAFADPEEPQKINRGNEGQYSGAAQQLKRRLGDHATAGEQSVGACCQRRVGW